jgi:hypothetical protein
MAADALNEAIEQDAPPGVKTEKQYDLMRVITRQTEGPNGIYLKVSVEDNQNNPDYEALLEDLKQHDGKLTKQSYFAWLFDDNRTVGMKPSKK